jgi:hypothetical protein
MPSNQPMTFSGGFPDFRYNPPDPNETLNWFQYRFLGLVHGHFDIKNLTEDSVVEDADIGSDTRINAGIGIVIPAHKIIETLYQPDLITERQQIEAAFDRDVAATPDAET